METMPLSLTIVIPTLNEADQMEALLASLGELRQAGAEIVLADGGSHDGTLVFVDESTKLIHAPRGRARQMNAGAATAEGNWLLFLHADTRLPPRVVAMLNAVMGGVEVNWGFFPIQLTGQASLLRWVEKGINWRSRWSCVATGDQAILVRRRFFEELGGFADISLMEDIELCKRMRKRARPLVFKEPVMTSSRRWEEKGILKTIATMWILRAAYACGFKPAWLAKFYYKAPPKPSVDRPH